MEKSEIALVVFLKNAAAGKVKTRIAATTDDRTALEVYSELTKKTIELIYQLEVSTYLYFSDHIPHDFEALKEAVKRLQYGHDLGARMSGAISECLSDHRAAVIIGSDCPYLTSEILSEAFLKLNEVDFVIGPACDGGYYLIGMTAHHPDIFENIEWSTSNVLRETINRIKNSGYSYHLLPELEDIDSWKQWIKYKIHIS